MTTTGATSELCDSNAVHDVMLALGPGVEDSARSHECGGGGR